MVKILQSSYSSGHVSFRVEVGGIQKTVSYHAGAPLQGQSKDPAVANPDAAINEITKALGISEDEARAAVAEYLSHR